MVSSTKLAASFIEVLDGIAGPGIGLIMAETAPLPPVWPWAWDLNKLKLLGLEFSSTAANAGWEEEEDAPNETSCAAVAVSEVALKKFRRSPQDSLEQCFADRRSPSLLKAAEARGLSFISAGCSLPVGALGGGDALSSKEGPPD